MYPTEDDVIKKIEDLSRFLNQIAEKLKGNFDLRKEYDWLRNEAKSLYEYSNKLYQLKIDKKEKNWSYYKRKYPIDKEFNIGPLRYVVDSHLDEKGFPWPHDNAIKLACYHDEQSEWVYFSFETLKEVDKWLEGQK